MSASPSEGAEPCKDDSLNTPKYTHLSKMESQIFSEVTLGLAALIYFF